MCSISLQTSTLKNILFLLSILNSIFTVLLKMLLVCWYWPAFHLYSTVVDVTLIRYSLGTGVYILCKRATRSFLRTAVAITWTIPVSYACIIRTVDIRPQLLESETCIDHQLNAQLFYSLIIYITLCSSTCFEHRCAHLQEENCI